MVFIGTILGRGGQKKLPVVRENCAEGNNGQRFSVVGKEMVLLMIVSVVTMLSLGATVHGIGSSCLQ